MEHHGVGVLCQSGVAQIALAYVNGDELYVGVQVLSLADGLTEQVAGHDDHGCTLVNSLCNGSNTGIGGVLGGLIVGGLDVVLLAVVYHGLVAGLVKGLVVDVADIGNKGDLVSAGLGLGTSGGTGLSSSSGTSLGCGSRSGRASLVGATAGEHCQHHACSQSKRSDSLHVIQPPKKIAAFFPPTYSCTNSVKNQPVFSVLTFFCKVCIKKRCQRCNIALGSAPIFSCPAYIPRRRSCRGGYPSGSGP